MRVSRESTDSAERRPYRWAPAMERTPQKKDVVRRGLRRRGCRG